MARSNFVSKLRGVFYYPGGDLTHPKEEVNPLSICVLFVLAVCGMLVFRAADDKRLEILPFPHYSQMLNSRLPMQQTARTPPEIADTGLIANGQVTLIGAVYTFRALDAMFQMTMAAVKHDFPCVAGIHFGTAANVTLFKIPKKKTLIQQLASMQQTPHPNATCTTPGCSEFMYTLKEAAAQSHSTIPANETYLTDDDNSFLFMLNAVCTPVLNTVNPELSFMVSTEVSHLCRNEKGVPSTSTHTRTRIVRCTGRVFYPKDTIKRSEIIVEVLTEGKTASCLHSVMDLTKPSIGTEIGVEGVCVPTNPPLHANPSPSTIPV